MPVLRDAMIIQIGSTLDDLDDVSRVETARRSAVHAGLVHRRYSKESSQIRTLDNVIVTDEAAQVSPFASILPLATVWHWFQ